MRGHFRRGAIRASDLGVSPAVTECVVANAMAGSEAVASMSRAIARADVYDYDVCFGGNRMKGRSGES